MSPATTETQKGTAMDYLAAPRDSGIVKNLMAMLGFVAATGGRLPAGSKYDTLIALNDPLATDDELRSMVSTRVMELQSKRRVSTTRVAATPESIVAAVQNGTISLEELKAKLSEFES